MQGEPGEEPEDWGYLQTVVTCRPPQPGQAGTRHLLRGFEAHQHGAEGP